METTENTAPATRTYCVWADCNRRVYQEVEAASPEDAHRIAKTNPGGWEFCVEHESNCYRLSDDVQNVQTDENFRIGKEQGAEPEAWQAYHDEDCSQWQVDDGSIVIATGIETEESARLMAAAPTLRRASQELYDRLHDHLGAPDRELPEGLARAMDAMEAAWREADGAETTE